MGEISDVSGYEEFTNMTKKYAQCEYLKYKKVGSAKCKKCKYNKGWASRHGRVYFTYCNYALENKVMENT